MQPFLFVGATAGRLFLELSVGVWALEEIDEQRGVNEGIAAAYSVGETEHAILSPTRKFISAVKSKLFIARLSSNGFSAL